MTTVVADEPKSTSIMKRYRDAYRVSNAIILAGSLLKFLGTIGGGVVGLGGIVLAQQVNRQQLTGLPSEAIVTFSIVLGMLILVAGWLFGIVLSAIGEMARAVIDTAVNTSPGLSENLRLEIMKL
jgi:hypothetical protein